MSSTRIQLALNAEPLAKATAFYMVARRVPQAKYRAMLAMTPLTTVVIPVRAAARDP